MSRREHKCPPRRINHPTQPSDSSSPCPGLTKLTRLLARQYVRANPSHHDSAARGPKGCSDE